MRIEALTFISSPDLLAELAEVLARPKFDEIVRRSNASREQLLLQVRMLAEVIDPLPLPQPVCCDPDDDDLLSLTSFEGIPILNPVMALQRVMNSA